MPLDRAPYLAALVPSSCSTTPERDGLWRRERHFGPFDSEPLLTFEAERRELSLGKLAEIGACPLLGEQKIVRLGQRLKPSAKGLDEGFGRGRRAERLLGHGKDDGEGVVDAVSELAEQQHLLLLCRLPLADVDQHVHGADQLAFFIVQRSGKRMTGMRVPSGRSTISSVPRTGLSVLRASAVGHSSCAMGFPSGQ